MSRKAKTIVIKTTRLTFDALASSIRATDDQLAVQTGRAVNIALTLRNWLIGCRIAEYELKGADRANYGEQLLDKLSLKLESLGVSACGRRQLYQYRRFYETFPQIVRTMSAQFQTLIATPIVSWTLFSITASSSATCSSTSNWRRSATRTSDSSTPT